MSTPSKSVTLLQDCYVESKHYGQVLSNGIAEKGDSIVLLSGNGYHTVVKPRLQWEDEQAPFEPEATLEAIHAAEQRMERATTEGFIAVYGRCYEGEQQFPG